MLTNDVKKLQVVLALAPAAAQLPVVVDFVEGPSDGSASIFNPTPGGFVTNGITPVDVVPLATATRVRSVLNLSVYNADSAPAKVTVQEVDGATVRPIVTVTLQVGYHLLYTAARGWYVMDPNGNQVGVGIQGVAGNTLLTVAGVPSNLAGVNGDFAYDPSTKTIYGPKAAGVWPAGSVIQGVNGTSLTRGLNAAVSVSAGVATIDIASGKEVYDMDLNVVNANVSGWTFTTLPAAGTVAEFTINIRQHSSSLKTCASPGSSGRTAGGPWSVTNQLGLWESIGVQLRSDGSRIIYPSGVQS